MGRNWIEEYYAGISTNEIVAGRWVRLVYEYLLKGLKDGSFFYDSNRADHAIEWIEAHCFHTEGPLAPGPLKLELWQKAFLAAMYGIIDGNGLRQFREALLVVGRKNGKSLVASGCGNYEFRGNGGFGNRVYCLAPKLEQADIVYNNIWAMVQLDPEWQEMKAMLDERDEHNRRIHDDSMLARHRMSDLFVPGMNSTVKKIAFSAKKSDGFNPSFCICDEVAAWEGDKGIKQYEVMKSGMGARPEGLLLSCTTSGYVNDGIYDELIKRATRLLMGDSEETRFLPVLYMSDDVEKWDDIDELRKANPNMGVSVSESYFREEIAIAKGSLSKKAEFICKYNCIKQNSSSAWLSTQTVMKSSGDHLNLEDFSRCYGVIGLDLSQTTDLTACTLVVERDERLYVFAKFWLPAEKIAEATARDGVPYAAYVQRGILEPSGENFVDYRDCFRWITDLVKRYKIYPLKIGYDRYSAQYLVDDLNGAGFHTDDVFQGYNLHGVIQELDGMMRDGRIDLGDNDLLKMHLLNAAIKMDNEQGRGKLVKLNPKLHIDGAAALLDAMTVRQKYYAEIGGQLKNARRSHGTV